MDRLLMLLLGRFVRRGTLRFTTARGSVFTVGGGSGPRVAIRFMTKAAERGVVLDPELKLGEAYMGGTLLVEDGTREEKGLSNNEVNGVGRTLHSWTWNGRGTLVERRVLNVELECIGVFT